MADQMSVSHRTTRRSVKPVWGNWALSTSRASKTPALYPSTRTEERLRGYITRVTRPVATSAAAGDLWVQVIQHPVDDERQ